jgi:hypothetical protein
VSAYFGETSTDGLRKHALWDCIEHPAKVCACHLWQYGINKHAYMGRLRGLPTYERVFLFASREQFIAVASGSSGDILALILIYSLACSFLVVSCSFVPNAHLLVCSQITPVDGGLNVSTFFASILGSWLAFTFHQGPKQASGNVCLRMHCTWTYVQILHTSFHSMLYIG